MIRDFINPESSVIDRTREGRPYQYTNPYRGQVGSYVEPDLEKIRERHARDVSENVLGVLRQLFGAQGMHTILTMAPDLRLDIEASVIEAYREGYYDAWLTAGIERGNEASARTGAMLLAALNSAVAGEDKERTTVRMLAAHAGVDMDTLDAHLAPESADPEVAEEAMP